ncbi:Pol polyprotein [Plakobranchus ocellatus]|uniref:Pol polyprotein n=1 Tax=Plakobranchus ocellatus TaxID=259542 RepID=A0AAV3Z4Y5_9GAST|nr:Pol polyprotein [Plakobranchus ocellatus]
MGRAVGECPVVQFDLLGVRLKAVVDTGSQVSNVTESYYLQHVEPRGRKMKRDLRPRLTAANGVELPYTGYLVATITIAKQVILERVFLVIKDPPRGTKRHCLLGMKVLKEITGWEGLWRAQGPDLVAQKLAVGGQGGKYARLAEDVSVPALSVTTGSATGFNPAFVGDLAVEPMEYPTKTIMAVPCVTEARNGRFSMSLLNAGEERIVLRRRTVVGILGDAEIVPPNIDLQVSSCDIEVYALSSRLHVPQEPDKAPLIEDMLPNNLPHEEKTALHTNSCVNEQLPRTHRKGKPVSSSSYWDKECQVAFNNLESALTRASVLGYADFSLPFQLEVDASFEGLGAILTQEQPQGRKVIAYASRSFCPNERNMNNYKSFKFGTSWVEVGCNRKVLRLPARGRMHRCNRQRSSESSTDSQIRSY